MPDVARYESGYHLVTDGAEFDEIIRTHRPPQIDDPSKVMRAERAQRLALTRAKDLAATIARLVDDASVAPASMAAQYVTIHKIGGTIRLEGVSDVRSRELARRAALEIGGSFVGYGYCADPVFVLIKADRKLEELLARARPQIVREGIAPEGLRSAKCAALGALLEDGPEASAAFAGIGESARITRADLVAALPYLDATPVSDLCRSRS